MADNKVGYFVYYGCYVYLLSHGDTLVKKGRGK